MATTENISHLFTPGSLATPEASSNIPRTILDAMYLTEAMGVNYLWVDRLCIVQDNIRHFNEQLQQMAIIYANSSFTIIALDGRDANHGLLGVGGKSLPRHYEQTYFEFSPEVKVLCKPYIEGEGDEPAWYTRAWTFQERASSRKTLVVGAGSVYWQCRTSEWYEYESPNKRVLDPDDLATWPFHALTVKRWPDFGQYISYVKGYNSRNLTFESDALKAFTAILTALSPSFPGGFLFGVPEFLFDVGLLWSARRPLKRRKDFPSWSWVGWSGDIEFDFDKVWDPEIMDWDPTPSSHLRVVPVINWHKISATDDSHCRINNSYSQYQSIPSMAGHSDIPISEGWLREKFRNDYVHGEIEKIEHDIYLHPLLEERPGFKFPVPVALDLATATANSEIWSPVLRFRAERCTMSLGNVFKHQNDPDSLSGDSLLVELCDPKGSIAGVIGPSFTNEKDDIQGTQCNLIAISMLSVSQAYEYKSIDIPEMSVFPELQELDPAIFYNVLWVEWENGIAYRKALGRVVKDAWERQDLEEIDIALG